MEQRNLLLRNSGTSYRVIEHDYSKTILSLAFLIFRFQKNMYSGHQTLCYFHFKFIQRQLQFQSNIFDT